MSLPAWLNSGWLVPHQTISEEIAGLLGVADRDLVDCRTPGLSPDWRLQIAYNAALQVAAAALAAMGYRASREAHHYRVIQSLAYTLGAAPERIAQFDQFRKKRNIGGYERAGVASDQEAGEMLALAESLRSEVAVWLRHNFPNLVS